MEQTVWEEAFEQADELNALVEEPSPISSDLTTLLELGKLEETVEIGNRKVRIRTLKIGQELEVGLLTKEYQGTSEQLRAEITAIVAAAVVSVDGEPLITSLGPTDDTLNSRFNYVNENFYWPVIRLIYQRYSDLQERAEAALKELDEKKD